MEKRDRNNQLDDDVLVSVVVPVYNIELYIRECIDSLINQNFTNYEIILVDDGSTDNSGDICDAYALQYKHIKVVHKNNQGLVSARKEGVRTARGKYIMPVDGDDLIKNNCLGFLSDILIKYKPEILSYGHCVTKDFDKPLYCSSFEDGYYNRSFIEECIFPFLIENDYAKRFPPNLWGKIIKKDLYLQYGLIDNKISIGEDFVALSRILYNCNSIYITNRIFYFYRNNISSMTKSRDPFDMWIAKNNYLEIAKVIDLKKHNFIQQSYRNICHMLFICSITQFYRNKSYKSIVKNLSDIYNDKIYKNAIKNAYYKKSVKGKLMMFCLKRHLFILMYIYSKLWMKY